MYQKIRVSCETTQPTGLIFKSEDRRRFIVHEFTADVLADE